MENSSNLRINFKKICYSCPHRDTYIDEDALHADTKPHVIFTEIGCRHETVCKLYLERRD